MSICKYNKLQSTCGSYSLFYSFKKALLFHMCNFQSRPIKAYQQNQGRRPTPEISSTCANGC